jgi:pimeloyl-ACP methyl ester carboxylesterase
VALRPWGTPFFRLVGENPEVFSDLPANLHRALVGAYIAGASYRPVSSEVHEALVTPWLGDDGQSAFYRQIAQADQTYTDEIEHLYSSIEVPTLIVWGEEDVWIPLDHSHRLNTLIKGSRLVLVDAAGHLVQEDRPKAFPSVVADWIAEQS